MVPIIKNIVPQAKWGLKCPNTMNPTRIVVHNTANDASAAEEISYMTNSADSTSYHYAIDDKQIIQAVPENRNAWHAGDGNGKGNRQGIGIEICYSRSGGERFDVAEENAAEFIASLLKKYGWGIDKVTKHQDYMVKYCPHRTLDYGWDRFLNIVKKYMNGEDIDMEELKKLQDQVSELSATVGKIAAEVLPKYGYIDENMPEWARPTIQKLYNKGFIKGDSSGNLQLSDNDLRNFVINDRAGVYGE